MEMEEVEEEDQNRAQAIACHILKIFFKFVRRSKGTQTFGVSCSHHWRDFMLGLRKPSK